MGTRGAWGFRINGADKVTYNHFDSYPEGLGQDVVDAIKTIPRDELRKGAEALQFTTGKPTDEQKERLRPFANLGVSNQSLDDWYCLLRQTQGDVAKTLEAGIMPDSSGFLKDSLFCEFAYIINLDEGVLEVYKGFQREPHTKGRYASETPKDEYFPIALVATFPLDAIPDDWSEQAFPAEEEVEA